MATKYSKEWHERNDRTYMTLNTEVHQILRFLALKNDTTMGAIVQDLIIKAYLEWQADEEK